MKILLFWIYLLVVNQISFSQGGDFNIIFQKDFETTPLGYYDYDHWLTDWNNRSWATSYCSRTFIVDYHSGGRVSRGMKWTFPVNTYGVNADYGYIWHTPLGDDMEECYLTYSIMFKPGFQSVKGGKIPGLREEHTHSGQRPDWDAGYKASLMFKPDKNSGAPKPVFYIYHHDQKLDEVGDTRYWNGYTFDVSSEIWYDLTIRVVMNTATATDSQGPDGEYDGIMEGYINGRLWGQESGLRLRNLAGIGTDQIMVNAFFGGNDKTWATIRDEWIMLDNFYVWTYTDEYLQYNPSVKRGKELNTPGTTIHTPLTPEFF